MFPAHQMTLGLTGVSLAMLLVRLVASETKWTFRYREASWWKVMYSSVLIPHLNLHWEVHV